MKRSVPSKKTVAGNAKSPLAKKNGTKAVTTGSGWGDAVTSPKPKASTKRRDSGNFNATDDPVRMYLMQMGEIPMLTREQEVQAAKNIEKWRTRFRTSMVASDLVLQGAVVALEKVRDGQLRLDRTIEVSVTNTAEKKRILRRIGPKSILFVACWCKTIVTTAWRLTRNSPSRFDAKPGSH